MSLFAKTKPARQHADPSDTVIPLYDFDDNAIYRNVLLYITLRFDEVLDPEKLRHSLERLMEIGDWRKLAARVRKTVPSIILGLWQSDTYECVRRTKINLSIIFQRLSIRTDQASSTLMSSTKRASTSIPSLRDFLGQQIAWWYTRTLITLQTLLEGAMDLDVWTTFSNLTSPSCRSILSPSKMQH